MNGPSPEPKPRWPRFLLAGVILFIIVNAFWVYREVQRVKWMKSQRDTNAVFIPPPSARPAVTNTVSTNGR